MHAWQNWSNAFRSGMQGGLLVDETANHFFMFTTRRLLRPEDRAACQNLPRLLPHDDDIVVLVKRQRHGASEDYVCPPSPWRLPRAGDASSCFLAVAMDSDSDALRSLQQACAGSWETLCGAKRPVS